mmetsp:Transcript_44225/g.116214  ORF Transcript_44225/g.116214 Transcript_44225/m.116214 type:complete len:213 (-) Transcript_44225:236-874(-)
MAWPSASFLWRRSGSSFSQSHACACRYQWCAASMAAVSMPPLRCISSPSSASRCALGPFNPVWPLIALSTSQTRCSRPSTTSSGCHSTCWLPLALFCLTTSPSTSFSLSVPLHMRWQRFSSCTSPSQSTWAAWRRRRAPSLPSPRASVRPRALPAQRAPPVQRVPPVQRAFPSQRTCPARRYRTRKVCPPNAPRRAANLSGGRPERLYQSSA